MAGILRDRATAVVIRDGRVLLVQGRSLGPYMMPGGEIEPNESPSDAAVRELQEETGLTASNAVHLMDWESTTNRHRVFLVEAEGEVQVGVDEIGSFLWWDRQTELALFPHVNPILNKLDGHE